MAVRILLVDDHPVVRQGLKTLLQGRAEWQVVGEASDGMEALEKVASLQPDVVVLDVTMPRMNGIEACRLMQRQTSGREVLFVTQHDSPQMMREALAAGARGYVVKSNLARDLVEAVEAVVVEEPFASELIEAVGTSRCPGAVHLYHEFAAARRERYAKGVRCWSLWHLARGGRVLAGEGRQRCEEKHEKSGRSAHWVFLSVK